MPDVGSSASAGFTGGLSDAQRNALFAAGRRREFAKNTNVFCEGDRSDFVVVIVEGRVKVLVTTADGGESVLGIRGPGALVGELAAFDGRPRVASAIALDPLTVRLLTAEEFRTFVAEHADAALGLIAMLIGRLREGDRRRAEFGSYDATARVAHLLADLAMEQLAVRLSQQEIAGLIGASRESVARALASLRARALVATGRGTITVLDASGLRSFVG